MITQEEVLQFQEMWGNGIINISQTFKNGGDYVGEAKRFIDRLYAYETEEVLFKPTLAIETQFRLDRTSALSYFVGGNSSFSEDDGFAIKGWIGVRWENVRIKIMKDCAVCMGNYFFSRQDEDDLKVEYSLVLKKIDGAIQMILHDSHLPYKK